MAAIPEVFQVAFQVFSKNASIAAREFRLVVFDGDDAVAAARDDLAAMSFWQPMASMVMRVSGQVDLLQSWGMAVISLDLSSVAT